MDHQPSVPIVTVGHGTLSTEQFTELLTGADVDVLVDIRRYPGSRRHSHFAAEAMGDWIPESGVAYTWIAALGGRRKPTEDQTNAAWRNPQFRAYADHMGSAEFRDGIAALLGSARASRAAVMCSEAVWWRCHRRLLADHLEVVEHVPVLHLFHDGRLDRHRPWSRRPRMRAGSPTPPADHR
jgi:uncharacterized protein (DUF488 family)